MVTYSYRAEQLTRLGFASYAEYLASELWQSIRGRVLAKNGRCQKCNQPAVLVHHTDYGLAILSGRTLLGLIPLCHGCHEWVEFDEYGRKLTLAEANAKLNQAIGDLLGLGRQPVRYKSRKALRRKRKSNRGSP